MDNLTLIVIEPLPIRRVTFLVLVVALAHPQKVGRNRDLFPGVFANTFYRPLLVFTGPVGRVNPMLVSDVLIEVILFDDFLHIRQDFCRSRDGRAGPRLEPVAKGIEIAIRSNAWILMHEPGSAETFQPFQYDEALVRTLCLEVVTRAYPGNIRANDQYINMFHLRLTL